MANLFHEKPLHFFPSIAVTIGLNESILLYYLEGFVQQNLFTLDSTTAHWSITPLSSLQEIFPFWDQAQLVQAINRLKGLGLLLIDDAALKQNICQFMLPAEQTKTAETKSIIPPKVEAAPSTKQPQGTYWEPGQHLYQQLAQHGIDEAFIQAQLAEFKLYWIERRTAEYAWDNKFFRWVKDRFEKQQKAGFVAKEKIAIAMHNQWQPTTEALQILLANDIPQQFIDKELQEFILYWKDKGRTCQTWDSEFIRRIKSLWIKTQIIEEANAKPRPIPID